MYSDGGIDVSSDGRYLLTCAMLFVPPEKYVLPPVPPLSPSIPMDSDCSTQSILANKLSQLPVTPPLPVTPTPSRRSLILQSQHLHHFQPSHIDIQSSFSDERHSTEDEALHFSNVSPKADTPKADTPKLIENNLRLAMNVIVQTPSPTKSLRWSLRQPTTPNGTFSHILYMNTAEYDKNYLIIFIMIFICMYIVFFFIRF